MNWNLADAQNRFTELVSLALTQGPQRVSLQRSSVVVLSWEEYAKLSGEKPCFKSLLMGSPDFEELDLARGRSPMREVE